MNIKYDDFSDEIDLEKNDGNGNGNDNGNDNDNDNTSYSIDDDDECVIEDCDEDSDEDSVTQRVSMKQMFLESEEEKYNIHDQLPSVEEVKSSHAYMTTARLLQKSNRNKLYLIIAAAAFAAMVISVTITIGIFKSTEPLVETNNSESNTDINAHVEAVVQFIFENGVSSLPDMRMTDSPEHRAVLFMAEGDGFHSKMEDVNMVERRRFVERYILALIFYQTNGENWDDRYDFLTSKDHCLWRKKIEIASGYVVRGVQCNGDNLIQDLDLSHNNLISPTISYEISHIHYLERLHLFGNDIGGVIPDFKSLANLKSLGLMNLDLVGYIPTWLGEMTSLTTLALGHTKLSSLTIPDSFAQLTNLRVLGLEGLGLTGTLEPTSKLKSLEALYLEDNLLSGDIYHCDWPNMKELDLSNNLINALFPESLIENKNLQIVDLHHNSFYGTFPSDIFSNDAMQYFDIHENNIGGTLSDRIGYLNKMTHFDVSGNKLTGTIPDTIQLLTDLISLRTSGNNFEIQTLKDFFTPLTNLQELAMMGNSFAGTLPNYFANLHNLKMMDLEGNLFNGIIPTFYGLMSNLSILKLNNNNLSGTIPSELSKLNGLKVLLLNDNRLQGKTKEICASPTQHIIQFTSDCYPSLEDDEAEVECSCCSLCCNDANPDCNDMVTGQYTKNWSMSYDSRIPVGDISSAYTTSLDQSREGWQEKALKAAQAPQSSF